jgi:hypothetical protein
MKRALLSVAAASLLSIAGSAFGATVSFTFQGCGDASCAVEATALDWQPGNVLAIDGAGGAAGLAPGSQVTNLYQANLNSVLNTGTGVFDNGDFGSYFTVVASFREVVIAGGLAGVFQVIPDAANYFEVYRNAVSIGNDLTGAGFANGSLVMSGVITAGFSTTAATSFVVDPTTGVISIVANDDLDNFGTNNYPGVTTITTVGGANIEAVLGFVDASYFPDLMPGDALVTALTSSSLNTPFDQTNPSGQFWSGAGLIASDIGTANGITGPNFQFQADAATSFERAIPEPGSMALVGLALLGIAGATTRRKTRV